MFYWFERSQVFHPWRDWETAPGDLGRPVEDIYFTAADGVKLNAWFFPADAVARRASYAVLVCHGNGGNISHRLALTHSLLQIGVSVLQFDYRGYGRSEGEPSEEGTYLDAQAAHRWLRERGFAPEKIIAFGESLGGAVGCELALR